MAEGTKGVVLAAIVANGVIAVAKFLAAGVTGSSAMMSEAFHSVADTGNQGLLLLGEARSHRPADERHPLGYGQEIYFWGLVVAIVLFGLGGGLSIYEGVLHLVHPEATGKGRAWGYAVLGIAFVAESVSFVVGWRALRKQRAGRGAWRTLRESGDPKLFIPLGEDAAALAGVVVAFVGVLLSDLTGNPAFDGLASIVIGLLLAVVALWLAHETRGLLVGETVGKALQEAVRRIVEEDDDVDEVRRVVSIRLSPEEVLLAIAVRFRTGLPIEAAIAAIRRMEVRIREHDRRVTRIWTEPVEPAAVSPR